MKVRGFQSSSVFQSIFDGNRDDAQKYFNLSESGQS